MATETGRKLNESTATPAGSEAVLLILVAASRIFSMDTIKPLIPGIYAVLKDSFKLSLAQIGLITLTFQVIGAVDRRFS
jgi:FSR family fosmidomycin resistance protein-like MFS transporter